VRRCSPGDVDKKFGGLLENSTAFGLLGSAFVSSASEHGFMH
jgi:hypothetical protein